MLLLCSAAVRHCTQPARTASLAATASTIRAVRICTVPRPHWDYSWQPPAEPPGTWDTAEIAGCCYGCPCQQAYDISDIEGRPE